MSFKKIDPKMKFPEMEKEVLKFWEENKIFEKSVENRKDAPVYSFYDGPPFASGSPHYGHIVGSTMKDAVPRFWTMKGFKVPRKWGWDCHGLPIENIAEKELGIRRKKEIEEMGVDKFNEFCRTKVLKYVDEWKTVINRLGRWADMENSYKTMDLPFMESVWWVFKELWNKGLIYEGHRIMYICTRCETTLSQSEVAEGYKDIKDLSVVAKFELEDEPGTFILAWTTTPWTLIGNVALAIGEDINYAKVKTGDELLILAKERIAETLKEKEFEMVEEFKGKKMIGKKYKPPFDYYFEKGLENEENGWKIYAGDFVTTEEGTGVVHIAPAFGEDDAKMGQECKLPFVQHVGMDGIIKQEATDFAGMSVKPEGDHQQTDVEVIKYLAKNNLLFSKEKYEHSYPHCWRCDTPLINYATSSWFVNITKIKEEMLENAKNINWIPAHLKEGRFGNWLEGARDWSISRQRFWASVIPIWKCDCGEMKVFGSVKELEDISGEKITDLHKHIVDKITFKCEKCGGVMKRIPDVLDTWFDSGSMPYAQAHYPFENKEAFDQTFPAQFIAEGVDQTRCWFYYLHAISTAIKKSKAYNNVVANGIVLAEDGKKMSKRLNNYPDPTEIFDKYGADALRFYLLSSPVVSAETINFKESEVAELVRGIFRMLWNSYSFFVLYANIDKFNSSITRKLQPKNLLDKWIVSELNMLINGVNESMEKYELNKAVRLFPKFIDNLSNWYIRRSRKRFWKSENDGDKKEAYQTLWYVLVELSKLMAPFTPFIAEEIYKNLTGEESVHLAEFPKADKILIDSKLNEDMRIVRDIVTKGLELRAKAGIKVRQPLNELRIMNHELRKDLFEIIKEEVNVKNVVVVENVENVELDIEITEDLKLEGQAREIIRHIQEMRKEAGYEVDNRIKVVYNEMLVVFERFGDMIKKETLANSLNEGKMEDVDLKKEFKINEEDLTISIKKA
ncbi:MAG: isoleucine--tRNA ligase [Parcubacteria group bacterium]|jgi:isoleucyl-tRNA synthetase